MKPFHTPLHDNIFFIWSQELNSLSEQIKTTLTKGAEFQLPKSTHPFYSTFDASTYGLGALLFQPNGKKQKHFFYFKSRAPRTHYQDFPTYGGDFCAVTFSQFYMNFLTLVLSFHIQLSQIIIHFSFFQLKKAPSLQNNKKVRKFWSDFLIYEFSTPQVGI